MPDMLTASQAAKLVGKSPSTIRRMIKEKKIPSKKNTEGWNMITKHDLLSAFMTVSPDNHMTAPQQSENLSDRTMNVLEKQLAIANTTIESLTAENRKILEENFRLIPSQMTIEQIGLMMAGVKPQQSEAMNHV